MPHLIVPPPPRVALLASAMSSSNYDYFSRSRPHGHATSDKERRFCFMRWLWKLLKRSGCVVSDGCHPIVGGGNLLHKPIKPVVKDDQCNTGNEDLDHVLSLAKDDRKNQDARYKGQDDDQQASATEESPSLSSLPYYPAKILPFSTGYRTCGGCHLEIGCGHYLRSNGKFWHPECFRCYACHQLICETEFCLSGSDPYHKSCYKELHHPKCDVCHEFIPTNGAGLIEYRVHPFWGQKYCPSHDHDLTRRCCGCERMESRSTGYMSLGDGRNLCMECLDSAIMDAGECQALYHSIRDYYEGMNMKIHQQIPMLLVERQALNEAMEGEKNGHHHIPETRGLCLSEEQTVSSILKRPKKGENRFLDVRTYPHKLTRQCEVTAILVLYGLPRLLTGSILAHELMHGWLRLAGYHNLSLEVEEGICQVLSHMWLEAEVMPGSTNNMPSFNYASSSLSSSSSPELPSSSSSSKKAGKSDIEKRLGEFFMHQIAHDTSTAYGEGFRAANAAVNKYGLRRTLDHIRLTGRFPL